MKGKIIWLMLMCNFSYAISTEDMVRNSHSGAVNLIQNNHAEKYVPNYSESSAIQTGNDFASIDDATLKNNANTKIIDANTSKDSSATSTIVKTSKRKTLDTFNESSMFQEAKKIYNTPLLKEITKDCRETINEPEDHYTKHTVLEERSDIVYEEQICEKPGDIVQCERELKLECEKFVDRSAAGIKNVTGNLSINWNENTGILTANTGWQGRVRCHTYNYYINFDVDNKDHIKEFRLTNVAEDDHIHISVNDKEVFSAPGGYRCELNAVRHQAPNLDLLSYLHNGQNKIGIALIVGGLGIGEITIKVRAEKPYCEQFKEGV